MRLTDAAVFETKYTRLGQLTKYPGHANFLLPRFKLVISYLTLPNGVVHLPAQCFSLSTGV